MELMLVSHHHLVIWAKWGVKFPLDQEESAPLADKFQVITFQI
jgi:hypothetical protein